MLTDTSTDDHILLVVRRLLVQFFDNLLRLHSRPGRGWLIRKWIRCLPLVNIGEPLSAWREFDQGNEMRQIVNNVSQDGNLCIDNFVDVLRLDLKVDDPATTLSGRSLCRWCEFW